MNFPAIIALGVALQAAQVPTRYVPTKPLPDAVLAKVNGVPIKASDIDKVLWDWMDYQVTEELIGNQILHDLAAKAGITVTQTEIEQAMALQMEQLKKQVPPGQDMETALLAKGFPKSRRYLRVEMELLANKLIDKDFKPAEYISVETLLVKPKSGSQADKEEAVGRAKDIYNRLKKGEDWDKILVSTNQDPNIIKIHGAIGWHPIVAFPKATQAEFATLKVHEVTQPAETSNGLQIFRVEALGAAADATVLPQLKADHENRVKPDFFKDLESKAKVERFIGKPNP